jgi:hypothetical protein
MASLSQDYLIIRRYWSAFLTRIAHTHAYQSAPNGSCADVGAESSIGAPPTSYTLPRPPARSNTARAIR